MITRERTVHQSGSSEASSSVWVMRRETGASSMHIHAMSLLHSCTTPADFNLHILSKGDIPAAAGKSAHPLLRKLSANIGYRTQRQHKYRTSVMAEKNHIRHPYF